MPHAGDMCFVKFQIDTKFKKKNVSDDVFCHVTKFKKVIFTFVFCILLPLQSRNQNHCTKHENCSVLYFVFCRPLGTTSCSFFSKIKKRLINPTSAHSIEHNRLIILVLSLPINNSHFSTFDWALPLDNS